MFLFAIIFEQRIFKRKRVTLLTRLFDVCLHFRNFGWKKSNHFLDCRNCTEITLWFLRHPCQHNSVFFSPPFLAASFEFLLFHPYLLAQTIHILLLLLNSASRFFCASCFFFKELAAAFNFKNACIFDTLQFFLFLFFSESCRNQLSCFTESQNEEPPRQRETPQRKKVR